MIHRQLSLVVDIISTSIRNQQSATTARLWALTLTLVGFSLAAVEPTVATTVGEGSVNVCDTDLAALFNNFMLLMSGLAPLGTGAFVSWHMFRAGTTSKSQKTKEHRENITQALVYGAGATLVFGLLTLGSGLIPGGVACV